MVSSVVAVSYTHLSDSQHGRNVEARAEQDDGKLQNFFGCKADTWLCRVVRLIEAVDDHAEKQRDDGRADEVQPGGSLPAFKPLCNRGQHQRKRPAGQQLCNGRCV